jgi:hypothetical protein
MWNQMKMARVIAVLLLVASFSSVLHAGSAVPELDPGNSVSVGMLLGGVLLVIRSRRK